ncbi:MAG: invasion associated locus B family protein [Alphaproteobacteria bacterium]|nr:invasion associated locus B family protein [Alphaproteobacteria bacterium]
MTVIFSRIAIVAFGLCASVASAYAQAGPTLLGTFDAWEAYKTTDGRGAVCWAVTQPQTKEPATAKRDPIYFLITTWPKANLVNEPSVVIGYEFKPGAEATVQVGSDKFGFFTKADGAWLMEKEKEQRLIAAMRGASELTVKGFSKRGTLTTDTYSLKGLSSALDKTAEGCK